MHKIAVLPGDGTGPEVTVEALKALEAVAQKMGFKYETEEFDFGGERYLRTNEVLPDSAVEELAQPTLAGPGLSPGFRPRTTCRDTRMAPSKTTPSRSSRVQG